MNLPHPHEVHVWLIHADQPEPVVNRLEVVLDDEERHRRAEVIHACNADRFTVAHGAVRLIVAAYVGIPAGQIRWRFGPNGKPELDHDLPTPHVNLSHSGNLALLALTLDRPVGVDVQQFVSDVVARRMAARYFPPDEAAFVAEPARPAGQAGRFARLWARKEACVKSGGGSVMQGMGLPVRDADHRVRVGVVVRQPDGALPGPYHVRDVPVPSRFRAAVALDGEAAFRISLRAWSPPKVSHSVDASTKA